MTRIRYDLIAEAIAYYEGIGYAYVEVPWIVSRRATDVTLPPGHEPYVTTGGTLVGSAEQSFIELALNGHLLPGSYVAASPCFRDDTPDRLHQNTFFKVELIELGRQPPLGDRVSRMVAQAQILFERLIPPGKTVQAVPTRDGVDIECDGIELGSYGVRAHGGWHWVYGTGLAEPRLSIASGIG